MHLYAKARLLSLVLATSIAADGTVEAFGPPYMNKEHDYFNNMNMCHGTLWGLQIFGLMFEVLSALARYKEL